MLPDLDSDSGRPVQEMSCFAAAVIPMLMLERFENFGWSREMMVLATAGIYAAVRLGVAEVFKRYTVHRGMWHSIPACIAVRAPGVFDRRRARHGDSGIQSVRRVARVLLAPAHDEIWSFQLRSGRLNIKKSFGTALKFWGGNTSANMATYATLALLGFMSVGDPMLMHRFGYEVKFGPHTAQQVVDQAMRYAGVQAEPPVEGEATIQR